MRLAVQHRGADLVLHRPHAGVVAQPLGELVAHQGPGEVQAAARPACAPARSRRGARGGPAPVPDLVHARAGEPGAGHHGGGPLGVPADQAQGAGQAPGRRRAPPAHGRRRPC
ncbi:hypothetical protein [Nocardioides convexus]|uniref:hypothetical protein n=1 Tax=Nocardioides convexus TaxID=2712224 RepID=UPI003101AF5A